MYPAPGTPPIPKEHRLSNQVEHTKSPTLMKRAELGLLEVLGLVVNAGGGNVLWGAKDSSLFYFWRNNRYVFYFHSGR
jgi:hypothetical protein